MYRVGICDDDKVFCSQAEDIVLSLSEELCQKIETEVWYSGESIMKSLSGPLRLDLIFLDIELYESSGIDVGDFIRNQNGDYTTHIVFVSSKQDYAMQLFKVQPLDFLIKPVTREQIREVLQGSIRQRAESRAVFEYQKGSTYYQLPCSDILYFMSSDKRIKIVVNDGDRPEFYGRLKNIADRLPKQFLTVHQSYIINCDYVSEYCYETVKMCNGDVVSISKPYRKEVRSRIMRYEKERLNAV